MGFTAAPEACLDRGTHGHCTPRAIAVVGSKGMMGMVVTAVSKFSGIPLEAFARREEALDWLAAQQSKP